MVPPARRCAPLDPICRFPTFPRDRSSFHCVVNRRLVRIARQRTHKFITTKEVITFVSVLFSSVHSVIKTTVEIYLTEFLQVVWRLKGKKKSR